MAVRVGINGFGRIGRQALKALLDRHPDDVEVVAINDLFDTATNAHLFKYDSNYGNYPGEVEAREKSFVVDGREIQVTAERDPAAIPWKKFGAQIVIESTGLFTDAVKAKAHVEAGAEKVIISAPARNEDITIVLGVNQDRFDVAKHTIISNASCTTNGLAPVAKVLFDRFGIQRGLLTTIHSYTNSQRLLDVAAKAMREYSKDAMVGILGYTEEPLVSSDFKGDTRSSIFSGLDTMVLGNLVKVVSWYNNEYGYACRFSDITAFVARHVGGRTSANGSI